MPMITRLDYERFIQRYLILSADSYGRVSKLELRRRVSEWRGSNYRTVKSHTKNLVMLGYLEDIGEYYQITAPTLSLVRKRVNEEKEEQARLILMQRHDFTGEPVPLEYAREVKNVTILTDISPSVKEEERVKDFGVLVKPPQTKLDGDRVFSAGSVTVTTPLPLEPTNSNDSINPPPQKPKEAEK